MEPLFEELEAALRKRPVRSFSLPGVALRESSVLVPLFFREGRPHALFTRRPMTLRTHAGQISFPGGGRDLTDPTPLHTALRETQEELGLPPEQVRVLGMLDELPTITRYRIAPFVGVIPPRFEYAQSEEVEQVIEVPLAALMDTSIQRTERRTVMDRDYDIYFYDYGPHVIWGATAHILRELLQVVATLPAAKELHR